LIPAPFALALTKTHFWRRIYEPHAHAPGWYEELVPTPVELLRAGELALRVRFLPPTGVDCAIEISSARAVTELTVIAAHHGNGMPHVLRWAELDQLARWAAVAAELPYPGWPTALLGRAAPICDADGAYPIDVLTRAFATTVALVATVDSAFEQIDCRGGGFTWTHGVASETTAHDPDLTPAVVLPTPIRPPRPPPATNTSTEPRWTISQSEPHVVGTNTVLRSTRRAVGVFPHAELAALLAAIDRELAPWRTDRVLELARQAARGDRDALPILSDALQEAGCDRVAILARLAPHGDAFQSSWVLELLLGLTPGTLIAPSAEASASASTVRWRNVLLSLPAGAPHEAQRLKGELARSGIELNTWSEDPPPADGSRSFMPVYLRGDFDAALAQLVAALRTARAPRGTVINVDLPNGRTIRL
jgi:hypothetical protein